MKILSTNNFSFKLLSKLLSDLSIGVHLKVVFDTKKFGSKVINKQYFHMKNSLSMLERFYNSHYGNVYLLVLSSWKVNIAGNPIALVRL